MLLRLCNLIRRQSAIKNCAAALILTIFLSSELQANDLTLQEQNEQLDDSLSLELLVKTIKDAASPATKAALMRGILKGLEGQRNIQTPKGWNKLKSQLVTSNDPAVRELSTQLSQIFGDIKAIEESLAILQSDNRSNQGAHSNQKRLVALRSLLSLRNQDVSLLLESLLDEPDLRLEAIRGYAAIENPVAPSVLLGRYKQFNLDHKRAVIETLATRKRYAKAMLNAIKKNEISKDEIPVHVARSMKDLLGFQFTEVFGELKAIGADREKQIAKYKKLITPQALEKSDVANGRKIFQKTCASCHLLYGEGGKVGPDLTGSNRANLDYILLNSVDPSYDVPDGYKMVTVLTVDGQLINGVVEEEDSGKLVLKTAEKPRVVIAKSDIESRKTSKKSIMPDGQLDQMKPQEVIDLINYLRTTEQVEETE